MRAAPGLFSSVVIQAMNSESKLHRTLTRVLAPMLLSASLAPAFAGHYTHFTASLYCRAYEVRQMSDPAWLSNVWSTVGPQLKIDKIYLETHRDRIVVDRDTLLKAKQFFEARGIRVAGGIATVANEGNLFQSLCYSTPADRALLKHVAELSASVFDEVILDDFFYSNCKCEACIRNKGSKSWTEFRLEQLDDAAKNLVVNPARKINPSVRMILKYPNWYEHYQGLGYNLAAGPKYFDGIYTGTETREPFNNDQHLQQYQSYLIFRYLENVAPGRNGGGWVDTGGMRYADRYAEQLWLTLFAKAPEITLFDLRQAQRRLGPSERAAWQNEHPSFDFDEMVASVPTNAGPPTVSAATSYVYDRVDRFLGKLGKPVGLMAYKPLNSVGEDFIHNYLGMAGVPFELTPNFPEKANTLFLAESASCDPEIVAKIKKHLLGGGNIIITSGLLRALEGKGIQDIAEIRYTDRKITFKDFMQGYGSTLPGTSEMTIPEIDYITNDAWALASASVAGIPYPLLLQAGYGKGRLYVLVLPENFGDLYNLPPDILNPIRGILSQDLPVRLEGPAQVALFAYDNHTFVVESFLPKPVDVKVSVAGESLKLRDLLSDRVLTGAETPSAVWPRRSAVPDTKRTDFSVTLKPHSYAVFAVER
jgi:hypothetical protein